MAGLLDLLSPGSDGGGLLDFLKRNAAGAIADTPIGAPGDQANYGSGTGAPIFNPQAAAVQASPIAPVAGGAGQPSPLDTAQWPAGPMGAPSNAMAQAPAVPQQPPAVISAGAAPAAAPSGGTPGFMTAFQNMQGGGNLIGNIIAGITGQRNDPRGVALQQQAQVANLTARALVAKGVDPQLAIAAVQPGNTELLKTLLPQALNKGEFTQETDKDGNVYNVNTQTGQKTILLQPKDDKFTAVTTKDPLGQETKSAFNTKTGEFTNPPAGPGTPGAPGFGSLLAQGVQYDPNKTGDEYMAQFSPEVQAAAKAYLNGDVMPTGNARKNGIATLAKTIAQKYGQDKGIPVSDAEYGAKRKMKIDLASSGNSSMGGILSNGESSFKHLAEYTGSVADQGNASHDFPLGGVIAHAQNLVSNAGGGSDAQAKIKAVNDNLGHYGQESTKFYAGTGGGVEERLNALKEMNATTTSGEESAAYAEKEKNLMLDRLNTKFQEIRNTLGEDEANRVIAKHTPDIQKNIATIDANVARLRGVPQAATAAATPKSVAPAIPAGWAVKVH